MKVASKHDIREVFRSDDGDTLTVRYTNQGEPFSQGVEFEFNSGNDEFVNVYLEQDEMCRLHEVLGKLLETMKR